MKFKVKSAGGLFCESSKTEYEEIGFTFRPAVFDGVPSIDDFVIKTEPEIEINSLDELIEFTDKFGGIVLERGKILIYDNYIE